MRFTWKPSTSPKSDASASSTPRRSRRAAFSWDQLEGRMVLSHFAPFHHGHGAPPSMIGGTTGTTTGTTGTTNTALTTALQTLHSDVLKIESASTTTVGQLATIQSAFNTLKADGLTPSSRSALATFENGLVTAAAGGTTLAGNATLLSQFEALYTASPTTQQATDLTAAYNALASAVTSANITSANITTINTDEAAVLAAMGSSSTATFPYFSLVTGQNAGLGGPGGCH